MLNTLWPTLIITAYSYGIISGRANMITDSIFTSASDAVNLCISLLGTICLWNGIMQIAGKTSIVSIIKKLLRPVIRFLFPDISEGEKAYEEISMNMVANIMGLRKRCNTIRIKSHVFYAKR